MMASYVSKAAVNLEGRKWIKMYLVGGKKNMAADERAGQ
jgi:hypothetical protein